MTKCKPLKPDPGKDFGIPAARDGDTEGVVCFAMFVERITMELSGFSPLPPQIKLRLAAIRKEATGLTEFARGYSYALKSDAERQGISKK